MTQRTDRLGKRAKRVLGEAIPDLKDPRIGFATVTTVRVSADLRHAHVFVSVLGSEEDQQQTMEGLDRAKSHLRAELGRRIRMKYLPELTFELDTGAEEAERLERLLHQIHQGEKQE